MKLILLSGGSGTRLWPLSNDARSKQFLRLLDVDETDRQESMIQRVVRQLYDNKLSDIIIATSKSQYDSVISQLGNKVEVVAEPSRRDTFPAICLACEYLYHEQHCDFDETIIVMPCDVYTQNGYFDCIKSMAKGIDDKLYSLMVMGIKPTYPSSKFGYIIASPNSCREYLDVEKFTEKPDESTAIELIKRGAFWNGGVFAFKLGYLLNISREYLNLKTYDKYCEQYDSYPKISFDYEVAEKASNIGVVQYNGEWKDLGTWNTLTAELPKLIHGNVITDGTGTNTHVINELSIPLLCIGTSDLIVAATPDGIIVSEKSKSEQIKDFASKIKHRPMYEERRWGTYKVIDSIVFEDGFSALTKQLTLRPGCSISYQKHNYRDEVWTFIDGEGLIVIDGVRKEICRGETVSIVKGQKHALYAKTDLKFIEVQCGTNLVEEDIERYAYDWNIELKN